METIALTHKDLERFWAKVDKSGDCWIWQAALVQKYGMFRVTLNGKQFMKKAHRIAYEQLMGPIPDGRGLDHICHVESCVNPAHLRPVTAKQNAENRTGANAGSTSGVRGVHWSSARGRWNVVVGHNGKHVQGGSFQSIEEAAKVAARLRAELFTHSAA
ncbi:HNH endonuclease signature motif containing protein [Arthrobacter sp. PsM3]|uniref:HNH endonuclease signature motif containing protein n=1 Tax=Arthrobacter sp. PsM3 TaxID=3030531 RepID=UPI00263B3A5A|nr:HNH endonuclease signature motif containing protein [Arthrobacter sp. PsM3]MDN4644940.1 HNH endonuclease signature motif containing protein [Arthrobacter sp. PsM3]